VGWADPRAVRDRLKKKSVVGPTTWTAVRLQSLVIPAVRRDGRSRVLSSWPPKAGPRSPGGQHPSSAGSSPWPMFVQLEAWFFSSAASTAIPAVFPHHPELGPGAASVRLPAALCPSRHGPHLTNKFLNRNDRGVWRAPPRQHACRDLVLEERPPPSVKRADRGDAKRCASDDLTKMRENRPGQASAPG
jgi:hypothetical protein